MISQTAEYALRAIVHLATHNMGQRTSQQIADATRVPGPFLSKVLQNLSRARLVKAQRGVRGGFHLARKPSEITVLEVVNAVDPVQRIHSCPLALKEHEGTLCPLHRRLDDAAAKLEEAFGSTTIADIVGEALRNTRQGRRCAFPLGTPGKGGRAH